MTTAPAPLAVTLRDVVGGYDVIARILIEPCGGCSDMWCIVDTDPILARQRRYHCKQQAKRRAAKKAKENNHDTDV